MSDRLEQNTNANRNTVPTNLLKWKNDLIFVLTMWGSSRLVILIAMLAIAPFLPAPPGGVQTEFGWGVFSAWDSFHYQEIANHGYGGEPGDFTAKTAFLPLFPLAIRILMIFGLSFDIAGTIINNLAFIGALIVLFTWVKERHSLGTARLATAVLAWCPFSLFCTIIYTEGIFLLFSTAALRAFDHKQYFGTAFWGALATATRVTGLALIPSFLIVAWQEKRQPLAYISGLLAGMGILAYALYCWLQFNQPFAFIFVQKAWQPEQAFWGQGWLKMLAQITIGSANWHHGTIKDPWHPLIFGIICAIGYSLWRWREKLGKVKADYGFCVLFVILWLVAGDPFINTVMVVGAMGLLWYSRKLMGSLPWLYGLCSMGIIFSSGRTASAERYVYGIVSVAIAFALFLENYPRWRYPALGFSCLLLALFAIRFAQHLWVA